MLADPEPEPVEPEPDPEEDPLEEEPEPLVPEEPEPDEEPEPPESEPLPEADDPLPEDEEPELPELEPLPALLASEEPDELLLEELPESDELPCVLVVADSLAEAFSFEESLSEVAACFVCAVSVAVKMGSVFSPMP